MRYLLIIMIALFSCKQEERMIAYNTFEGNSTPRAEKCARHFKALGNTIHSVTETDDGYDLLATDNIGQEVIIMVSDYEDEFSYLVVNRY